MSHTGKSQCASVFTKTLPLKNDYLLETHNTEYYKRDLMTYVDCLAILFSGGKVYLILLGLTIKINHCCVIRLAQYILVIIIVVNIQ